MVELKVVPEPAVTTDSAAIRLPLVSFIVTNFNYGRFLDRCIASIFGQDYPSIECILVDDCSTDGSQAIIQRLGVAYPAMKVVLNVTNLGQTRACLAGYALSRGHYIALIDADDYLMPGFAAAHIKAHMSLRVPVGFSSCDMLACVGDEIVGPSVVDGAYADQAGYIMPKAELRKMPAFVREALGRFDCKLRRIKDEMIAWVWGPTSSNVYRRDALALFADNPRIGKLKFATDAYFNFGIHALCGSVFIEKAFAVYHIHASNNFTKGALLAGVRQFEHEKDYGCFAAFCALEHIVLNFVTFAKRSHELPRLLRGMRGLSLKARQARRSLIIGEAIYIWALRILWRRKLPSLVPFRR